MISVKKMNTSFAFSSPAQQNFQGIADALPAGAWKPLRFRGNEQKPKKQRKRRKNLRRRIARARGKRDLKLVKEWVAEFYYQPSSSEEPYRFIVRRQRIEESNQGQLFECWRYRYIITNLPQTYSAEEVIRLTYQRCDQENIIEQLQSGIAAMRMPSGSFWANAAFLTCARLAHNLKSWLAQIGALPIEVMRWKWKRFRHCFVYLAARVIRSGRQTLLRLSDSHRFAELFRIAVIRLQT